MGDDGARRRDARGPSPAVLTPPTGLPAARPHTAPERADGPRAAPERAARDVVVPPRTPPAAPPAVVDPCVCRHDREVHEHWRRGSDCGICGPRRCPRYRRRGGAVRRFLRRAR